MKKLNTVQETAKILGITKTSVYALIASGVLEKVDAGAKEYITPASLNKLLIGDTEKNNMAEHGYPLSEEVGLMLPNGKGNNSMDGDEMEYSGNISKLSDGRYMVQINLGTDENGKRKRYSKSFRDMTSAQIHLGEKLNELNHPKTTILLDGGDEEHDKTVAYSLSIPFISTFTFAAVMKHQDAPGTTFKRHMQIAQGVLSEDDTLLREILFNPYTKHEIENIRKEMKELIEIIDNRDEEHMQQYLTKIRNNIK